MPACRKWIGVFSGEEVSGDAVGATRWVAPELRLHRPEAGRIVHGHPTQARRSNDARCYPMASHRHRGHEETQSRRDLMVSS
jgi:hypothetical protein